MTLAKRIIPCLDVDNGRVVKGINFKEVKDAGDPVEFAKIYSQQGADELVFLDKKLEDARDILLSGADKVSINTSAIKNPELITELMSIFGKQCIVVAIDVKKNYYEIDSKETLKDNHEHKLKQNKAEVCDFKCRSCGTTWLKYIE